MIDIDTSDRSEQRKFGIVMAAAIIVLGLLRWGFAHWLHPETAGGYPLPFLVAAAPFLLLGLVAPRVLKPVFDAWLKLALVLNWIMTRLLLTVIWFLIFIPTSGIMRLLGKRMLVHAWDRDIPSYWEEPEEQPDDIDRYRHQF